MTEKSYNGWTNYETWVVKLWMDNEHGSHIYWQERSQDAITEDGDYESQIALLRDWLKDAHEESMPTVEGVWSDLLSAALSEVNWYEIAKSLIDDLA